MYFFVKECGWTIDEYEDAPAYMIDELYMLHIEIKKLEIEEFERAKRKAESHAD